MDHDRPQPIQAQAPGGVEAMMPFHDQITRVSIGIFLHCDRGNLLWAMPHQMKKVFCGPCSSLGRTKILQRQKSQAPLDLAELTCQREDL